MWLLLGWVMRNTVPDEKGQAGKKEYSGSVSDFANFMRSRRKVR